MQPSEIDRLSTYEFRKYVDLLEKQIKADRDYDLILARNYGIGNIFRGSE